MKLLICVHHPFDQWNETEWFPKRLSQEFPQVNVVHLPDYTRVDEEIGDAEIVIAWSIRPEQIASAKKLRWIHSPAAAVHQLIFPELVNSEIVLTNAREVHGPVVAEHVIALIFALAKKIPGSVRLQEKHVWGQQILWDDQPRVREVAGPTAWFISVFAIRCAVVQNGKKFCLRVNFIAGEPWKGVANPALSPGPRLIRHG